MSPRQSIEAECSRRGRKAVVRGCITLLRGHIADDDLVLALGGPAAQGVLEGREGGRDGYWPRVWAARGLLHAWDGEAVDVIVEAAGDASWRVREMAANVVAKHRLDAAFETVLQMRDDPVPRVRAAAQRALQQLAAGGR